MTYDTHQVKSGDDNRRQRISVFLISAQRPKYWSFHCIHCGDKLCELSGDVVQIRDLDDMGRYEKNNTPINIRCKGRYCNLWYEITLGS